MIFTGNDGRPSWCFVERVSNKSTEKKSGSLSGLMVRVYSEGFVFQFQLDPRIFFSVDLFLTLSTKDHVLLCCCLPEEAQMMKYSNYYLREKREVNCYQNSIMLTCTLGLRPLVATRQFFIRDFPWMSCRDKWLQPGWCLADRVTGPWGLTLCLSSWLLPRHYQYPLAELVTKAQLCT